MNTNSGHDPMLSSFITDDWGKLTGTISATASPALSLVISQPPSSTFLISTDALMSPDQNFSDLAAMWSNERKRVPSVKMEDDDSFSSYSVTGDMDGGDTDMGEIDIGSSTAVTNIKSEIEDHEYGNMAVSSTEDAHEFKLEVNKCNMTEAEARHYVQEQFEKIAFVPKPHLSQWEKIEYILAKSDCNEFSVQQILNFDKKCPDSARACAKIVQNIPQRYRWECVQPEDIPCCYTIVADCKKVSSRDKPPRPMNAFMIWAQGARRLINELCPKMQNAIISEALGYYWRQKSDAFKQRFEQEKMRLRIFHNVEFPEYKYKPKTKIQKAKEKQQLSLTKAKIRASVKLEKLRRAEELNNRRSNTGIRPKKTKQDSHEKEVKESFVSLDLRCENSPKKSPTKPAIKDMLTLKILNDRKCKGMTRVTSTSQELICSSLGQLSPLEVNHIDVDEQTDVVCNLDIAPPLEKDVSCQVMSASVFDTPANTPPVDDGNDDRHHSPHHSQLAFPAVSSISSSIVSSTESALHTRDSLPTTSPTLTSFSTVHILPLRDGHSLSLLDLVSRTTTTPSNKQQSAATSEQVLGVTDWLFNYIAQSMSAADQPSCSNTSKYSNLMPSLTDANNNSSDINNNTYSDLNNNIDLSPNSVTVRTSSKLTDSPTETGDLDTLLLDLNGPFLSDDDLKSIMNTL